MIKSYTVIFIYFLFLYSGVNAQTTDNISYNPDSVLIVAKQNYKEAVEKKDTARLIDLNLKLFEIYKSIDIIDSAKEHLYSAITLSEKSKDYNSLILGYISLAELLRATYHSDVADKYIYSALHISFDHKNYTNVPYAYNRLAAIFFEKFFNKKLSKDTNFIYKAIQYADTSMYWSKKLNTDKHKISNYNILGACYSTLKKYDKSNTFFRKALYLSKINKDLSRLPYIYKNIAQNFYETGNTDSAIYYSVKSAKLANKYKLNEAAWFNYDFLTSIYLDINDYKNAFYYHSKKDSIEEINRQNNSDKKLREFKAEYTTYKEKLLIQQQEKQIKYFTIFLAILIPLFLVIPI